LTAGFAHIAAAQRARDMLAENSPEGEKSGQKDRIGRQKEGDS